MFCKIGILQLGQRTSKNLYKSSFLVKMKDGLIMVLLYRYFGFIEPLCRWLPSLTFLKLVLHQWELQIPTLRIISKSSDMARTYKHLRWSFFAKIFKGLKPLTFSAKRIHFKCLIGASYATEVRINYLVFFFINSLQNSSNTLTNGI